MIINHQYENFLRLLSSHSSESFAGVNLNVSKEFGEDFVVALDPSV